SPRAERQFVGKRHQRVGGHLQIFRMAAMLVIAIDLDWHLLAQLLPTGPALVALRATLIMMHHDALADARLAGIDRGADRDYDAARLMPDDDGTVLGLNAGYRGLAFRPAVLMQVGAA